MMDKEKTAHINPQTGELMYVYGTIETEQDKEDRRLGIVRYHSTTYLECSVPIELEERLSNLIDVEIAKFERECQCENCKKQRNEVA